MIVIGIDPHKASVTAAALGPNSDKLDHRRLATTTKMAAHLISLASAWPARLWAGQGAVGQRPQDRTRRRRVGGVCGHPQSEAVEGHRRRPLCRSAPAVGPP